MASLWQRFFGGATLPSPVVHTLATLEVDMHSHLLPGLDDGAETIEHSLELLQALRALGYRKLVMTPHIMGDFYKNTPEGIRAALQLLREAAAGAGLGDVELECAAEYYLDEFLGRKLADGTEMLTFGGDKRYLLFETSYMNEPLNLFDVIFELNAIPLYFPTSYSLVKPYVRGFDSNAFDAPLLQNVSIDMLWQPGQSPTP